MKLSTLLVALIAISNFSFSQIVNSSIANWKNDATGAYSIIHDDYGATVVDGIWQYADTIAANRGLKFTFGAITSDCESTRNIKGEAGPYAYAKNVMIAQHNHEIINHSHTHTCAVNRGWSPCLGTGWGEVDGTSAWNSQLITSTNSIQTNTGHYPRYYIYPYDQFTDLANDKLEELGYIGSRTGWHVDGIHAPFYKWGYERNDENLFESNSTGFFRTSVQVFDDNDAVKSENDQVAELNLPVDTAILLGGWANRELHNVGWSGWGYVKVNAYRRHLNYVKSKVDAGEIWMGTVSEILTYQIQKLKYVPSANFNALTSEIDVSFSENNSVVNADVGTYLSGLTIKCPVTVILDVAAYTGLVDFNDITVKQGINTITDVTFENDNLYINLFPSDGSFTVESNTITSIGKDFNVDEFTIYPNPAQSLIFIKGDVEKIEVFDSKGSLMLTGTTNKLQIDNLSDGVYYLKINNSLKMQKLYKR